MKEELNRDVERVLLKLDVNGERAELLVPVHKTLLEVLREDMGLTGTPAARAASSNTAGCGLRWPASTDVTMASTYGVMPRMSKSSR